MLTLHQPAAVVVVVVDDRALAALAVASLPPPPARAAGSPVVPGVPPQQLAVTAVRIIALNVDISVKFVRVVALNEHAATDIALIARHYGWSLRGLHLSWGTSAHRLSEASRQSQEADENYDSRLHSCCGSTPAGCKYT